MTMVLRQASPMHRTRSRIDPGLFVLDESTSKCLRYENAPSSQSSAANGQLNIEAELLAEYENISLRNDLIDCHLDICTPDIPALFTENFDYNQIRSDFVRQILTADLLGKTIYAHIIDEGYAARVRSLQTYTAVSKDIVSRYVYPVTPDSNIIDGQTYKYQRGHIYKENGVVLAQSCVIESNTVIGANTYIGDKTHVNNSVIGRRCKIGNGVQLDGVSIWDDSVIEDNSKISNSILASNVLIKQGADVKDGSIVSYGVIVGKNQTISGMKLTRSSHEGEEEQGIDHEIVGEDGLGSVYILQDSDVESTSEDEDSDQGEEVAVGGVGKGQMSKYPLDGVMYNLSYVNISDSSIASETDIRRAVKEARKLRARSGSSTSYISVSTDEEEENFEEEAEASVTRSIKENHPLETALLELNTLRMTMNASFHEVRSAVMAAFVGHVTRLANTGTLSLRPATEKTFSHWLDLLRRFVSDEDEQLDLLKCLETQCARGDQGSKILLYSLPVLYDKDVVSEEIINAWWDKSPPVSSTVRNSIKPWIDWLRTAEEESDDE